MPTQYRSEPERYAPFRVYGASNFTEIPQVRQLSEQEQFAIRVVAEVLPFRVNQYVIDHLIRWEDVPDDPIFRLVFPQAEMLDPHHFDTVARLLHSGATAAEIRQQVAVIQGELNPHPAGQATLNVPRIGNERMLGAQHKYRETLLFFPAEGQTCHAYCSFCFRWPQFVQDKSRRMASRASATLHEYLASHLELTDVLVTGGDPLVMKSRTLEKYLAPLIGREFEHVQNIRIGTKALTFWPHRFVSDPDADALLALLSQLVDHGKHVALMAHFEHPHELQEEVVRTAVRRILDTGAVIRTQAPVLRHINDDASTWAELWRNQVRLGMIPYYMFVERDTGARRYFEVSLARAHRIYCEAIQQQSGLGRTARGPVMSAEPGKVEVLGISEIGGETVFNLRLVQARNPEWTYRPFYARFDAEATWFNQLQPAFGAVKFFFEE